jgi:hypothetical protein
MALLGFLASGAAQGFAQAKNAETEAKNRIGSIILQEEVRQMYDERLAERTANNNIIRDGIKAKLDKEKQDAKHANDKELEEIKAGNRISLEEKKKAASRELEVFKQGQANTRHKERLAQGLLNTGGKQSDPLKGVQKEINDIDKQLFNINDKKTKALSNQNLMFDKEKSAEVKDFYDNEIKRLTRMKLHLQGKIDASGGGGAPALDLAGHSF